MSLNKHIVIVAGEESGDMHAASLVKALKASHASLRITGVGGQHMQKAGVAIISDLAAHGVTGGPLEIIRHVSVLRKAWKDITRHLEETRPDLLILVDYPGFNLRLAKFAKRKLNLRILYYISPQIWAWKASRIHTIVECVDRMAVILPFEKAIYEKAAVPVSFVGHPLTESIVPSADHQTLRQKLGLPLDKRIIAILPGSRRNEIETLLPIMRDALSLLSENFHDLHIALPIAASIKPELIEGYFRNTKLKISLIKGQARDLMDASDLVVVASGTASLEAALLTKPMCILYRSSRLTYMLATQLIRVQYLGLCNLLSNFMIVPELLQDDCNAENLAQCLADILSNETLSRKMVERLVLLKNRLSLDEADCTISELVVRELQQINS